MMPFGLWPIRKASRLLQWPGIHLMYIKFNHKCTDQDSRYSFNVNESPCVVSIGSFTYFSDPLELVTYGEPGKIEIGKFCSIADGVRIYFGGMHAMDGVSTYPAEMLAEWMPELAGPNSTSSKGPVVIGNDVWIGEGASILSGVTVGDGAIIGARAVVSRNVPPYGVAVGNPARVVRKRVPDADADFLLSIRWWSWPNDKIRRFARLIFGGDVEAFRLAVSSDPDALRD
ncbi:transferase hexapeptide (six repeat-containing protein) [Azospirillum oryzae]|uniref:Transferase hexapeptide (Six repeat-containing protein) n=2 Tax=Azospirillum oryzae TaxID=286727 RepID=A0A1X7F0H5_9PROT|nr:transferase hexapeptide (six repeat-containing protein) [Azospirillum oryzae]